MAGTISFDALTPNLVVPTCPGASRSIARRSVTVIDPDGVVITFAEEQNQ